MTPEQFVTITAILDCSTLDDLQVQQMVHTITIAYHHDH
jgi:hypothetical protein